MQCNFQEINFGRCQTWLCKRDFALGQKLQKYKNELGQIPDPKCSWVWPDFVETFLSPNGASEYSPRGTRSVPRGAPMGRPEGAELFTAQNTGVPNVTLRSAPWGRPKGTSWYTQVGKTARICLLSLPTPLQNTLRSTLFSFRKRKSGILPDPLGTPLKSLYESHAWRPLIIPEN